MPKGNTIPYSRVRPPEPAPEPERKQPERNNTGTLLGGAGMLADMFGVTQSMNAAVSTTDYNSSLRINDITQLRKSLADNAEQLSRNSRRGVATMKTIVASNNLVLEGSPLMAVEEAYQNGQKDLASLNEQAMFQANSIQAKISQDYQALLDDLEAKQWSAVSSIGTSAYNLWGK